MTDNLLNKLLETQENLKNHIEKNRKKHIPKHIIDSVKDDIKFLEDAINIEKAVIEHEEYIKKYSQYKTKSEIQYVNSCIQYTKNMQRAISEGVSYVSGGKPPSPKKIDESERHFDKEFLLKVKNVIKSYKERGDDELVNKFMKYYLPHFTKHNIEIIF